MAVRGNVSSATHHQQSTTGANVAVASASSHSPSTPTIALVCCAVSVVSSAIASCAALAPLTIGVILSAVTELNLVLVGFLAAIAAALANVLNSIYTKRAISHVACPDPIIFHMYTAATATIILLPYALLKDARDWLNGPDMSAH